MKFRLQLHYTGMLSEGSGFLSLLSLGSHCIDGRELLSIRCEGLRDALIWRTLVFISPPERSDIHNDCRSVVYGIRGFIATDIV